MPIPDERLLGLIESGDIVVGLDNPETISVFGRSNRAYLIGGGGKRNAPDSHKRWAFGFKIQGRRRTIVRAKLVYLAGSRRPIPNDFDIHHLDEDPYNDDYENLISLHKDDHKNYTQV